MEIARAMTRGSQVARHESSVVCHVREPSFSSARHRPQPASLFRAHAIALKSKKDGRDQSMGVIREEK